MHVIDKLQTIKNDSKKSQEYCHAYHTTDVCNNVNTASCCVMINAKIIKTKLNELLR